MRSLAGSLSAQVVLNLKNCESQVTTQCLQGICLASLHLSKPFREMIETTLMFCHSMNNELKGKTSQALHVGTCPPTMDVLAA